MTEADLLFSFIPLASDHANGLVDVGTPDGYEDIYAEEVWDPPVPHELNTGPAVWFFLDQKKYFTNDFIIYGLKAVTQKDPAGNNIPYNPANSWSVRLIDVDGVPLSNTRVKGEMLFGVGQFPKPCLPPLYVPAGKFIGIEFGYEQPSLQGPVQLQFLGLRRRKVRA